MPHASEILNSAIWPWGLNSEEMQRHTVAQTEVSATTMYSGFLYEKKKKSK
jgi:hypothetical protein